MDEAYFAGLLDGDASVNVTTGGGRNGCVLRVRVELTQCDRGFLEFANELLGGAGRILEDGRKHKYSGETAYVLRFDGSRSRGVLELMRRSCVLKHAQASLGLDFLDTDSKSEREKIRRSVSRLNADKSYEKRFERLSLSYVAGLFDAEGDASGTVRQGGRTRVRVRITQKSAPDIVRAIRDFLGYGNVSETFRYVAEKRSDVCRFSNEVAHLCRLPKRLAQLERVKGSLVFY